MRVEIDEARGDIHAAGIDDLFRLMGLQIADFGNLAILDPDVGAKSRHPCAIDYCATSDDYVELCHFSSAPASAGNLIFFCAPFRSGNP
jgi:hypothetical protein